MAPSEPHPDSPLRQARREQGLRQKDVADAAGCAVSYVCMAERGWLPSPRKREAIAGALGASAGSFW